MPSSQSSNTLNDAIAVILASGLTVTLTPSPGVAGTSTGSGSSAILESTPTPAIPSTPAVSTTSVAQSNTNTRFSCLSSVTGTASTARSARLNRPAGEQAQTQESEEEALRPVNDTVPVSVTFYLWESGKDIIRLQGGLLHELPANEYFVSVHIFGSEFVSSHDRNILKQSGYQWRVGDHYLLAGEVIRCGKGPLQAHFVTDYGISPLAQYRDFCQRFPLERATGRRRIHVVIQRTEEVTQKVIASQVLDEEDENYRLLTLGDEEDTQAATGTVHVADAALASQEAASIAQVADIAPARNGRANSAKKRQRAASPIRRSQRKVRRRL